ncbi:hypothetical protein ACVJGD_008628 [Bradyrhizobium sp. USDA 10063]
MSETEAPSKAWFSIPEWLESLREMPSKLFVWTSKEALRFSASCLQDQATYLKDLADCTTPSEALKCQLDFAQQSWSRSFSHGSKILEGLNTHSPLSNR